jgi:hypothetical protein
MLEFSSGRKIDTFSGSWSASDACSEKRYPNQTFAIGAFWSRFKDLRGLLPA